jgi:hypothetical protein
MKLKYSYVTTAPKTTINWEGGFESHTQQILLQYTHTASTAMATKYTDKIDTDVNIIILDILCLVCVGFWTFSDKYITLPFLSESEECKCTISLTAK